MNVVVTAPMPGIRMPSFPSAGLIMGVGFDAASDVVDKRFSSFLFAPLFVLKRGGGRAIP
jgi:hypothetical protein